MYAQELNGKWMWLSIQFGRVLVLVHFLPIEREENVSFIESTLENKGYE